MNVKEPQWSEAAERGFLAGFLLEPKFLDEYGDFPPETLYSRVNAMLLEVMRDMAAKNEPLNLVSFTVRLEKIGILNEVGGAAAISELYAFVPTGSNHAYYAGIIRENWVRRRIVGLSRLLHDIAYQAENDTENLLSQCEAAVIGLRGETEAKKGDSIQQCGPALIAALDHLDVVYKSRGGVIGLPTGIIDWDRMTGGMMGGDMITIAGRPSHGKSALGMQVAEHNAIDLKNPTLVFSCEMPNLQLMLRSLCSRANINLQRVRDGFMGKNEMLRISSKAGQISGCPLYLDDTAGLSTAQFRSRARQAKVRHGIKLIVVDYLQIMQGSSKRAKENRQQEIAEISGTIKQVAKELNIPIIVLAQLNRDAEDYAQPKLSHLRESGSIEQDSDQVALIHRLDKAKAKKPAKNQDEDEDERDHNSLLLLEKQRNGPTGPIKLKFIKEHARFENVTKDLYSNNEERRQH